MCGRLVQCIVSPEEPKADAEMKLSAKVGLRGRSDPHRSSRDKRESGVDLNLLGDGWQEAGARSLGVAQRPGRARRRLSWRRPQASSSRAWNEAGSRCNRAIPRWRGQHGGYRSDSSRSPSAATGQMPNLSTNDKPDVPKELCRLLATLREFISGWFPRDASTPKVG